MPTPATSAWKILADQMTSVVVLLLAAAATVSVILGDYIEAAAIGAVLVLNTAMELGAAGWAVVIDGVTLTQPA